MNVLSGFDGNVCHKFTVVFEQRLENCGKNNIDLWLNCVRLNEEFIHIKILPKARHRIKVSSIPDKRLSR